MEVRMLERDSDHDMHVKGEMLIIHVMYIKCITHTSSPFPSPQEGHPIKDTQMNQMMTLTLIN